MRKQAAGEPVNDNADSITVDDVLLLLVLVGMFAGTIWLLAYVMLGGTDDVIALLQR